MKNLVFFKKKVKTTVLVAPLDWGLGHAARCVPLIRFFLNYGCDVIIAATGAQKKLLQAEFPLAVFVSIPNYQIKYTTKPQFFSLKIALQLPKIFLTVYRENKWLKHFLKNNPVDVVIADNRYGLHHKKISCVFITHQLLIKAPFALVERMMQHLNYHFLQKFSRCWIPDEQGSLNMAGALSHPVFFPKIPVKYLGGLSRLEKKAEVAEKYYALIILSGPEPQRTALENLLLAELDGFERKVLLVRGLPGDVTILSGNNNLEIKNHLPAKELEQAMNESAFVISRSGYTTVMDIFKLQKKSILIPTPGQTEQLYLAGHLQKQGWCVAAAQKDFSLKASLQKAENFNYNLPQLDMKKYEDVLEVFINELATS